MNAVNGTTLPQAEDAEKALLSCLLGAPVRVLDECIQHQITERHFHNPARRCIYDVIRDMMGKRKLVTNVTLAQTLHDRGILEEVGGDTAIAEAFTFQPSYTASQQYIEILKEKAMARRAIEIGRQLVEAGSDPTQERYLSRTVRDALHTIELSENPSGLPAIINSEDLCADPPPTPPEIIRAILHQGSKLALGGGSKSFKTWTLLEMALCVATGREWLGLETTQGRVLYVNFELPEFSIEQRIQAIRGAMGLKSHRNLELWNLRGYAADADKILPKIAKSAKGYSLVILDPLYKLLAGREENSNTEMANLMNAIERLAVECLPAVAFGSHFAKGNASGKESMDRISGAGVFARDPDSIVTMTAHEQPNCFTVEMTLRNFAPQEPFVVRREHPLMVIDGKLDPAKLKQVAGRKEEISAESVLGVLGNDSLSFGEWRNRSEEELLTSTATFKRKLQELKNRKRVRQSPTEGGKYVRA